MDPEGTYIPVVKCPLRKGTSARKRSTVMSGDSWTRLAMAEVAPELGWSRAARTQAEGDPVGKRPSGHKEPCGRQPGWTLLGRKADNEFHWSPPELLIMTTASACQAPGVAGRPSHTATTLLRNLVARLFEFAQTVDTPGSEREKVFLG